MKKNELLSIINNYIYDSNLSINLNIFYQFGSLLALCLIIQIITGILLAFYYIPQIDLAFDSIEYIMREVPYGWLIRMTHANTASFFFIVVYLHIVRGLLYGSYIGIRKSAWTIGVIILLLMIITAFIGYSLVFGQMSYWAVTVITSLITTIPIIGQDILHYIWGSYNVSGATLTRFFALHYLMPFIIAALSIAHLITIHEAGGSNPLGINSSRNINYINFHPYYTIKDILGFIMLIVIILFFVFYYPNLLGHPDNYIPANSLVTPTHIVPEFYLLPYYAILRSIPNKTLGVIGLLCAILFLIIIPYLHLGIINTSTFRPIYKYFLYIFFVNFLILTYIGKSPVAEPYILIGQLATIYYYIFLLLLIPIISFFETLLFILIQDSKK